MAGWRDRHRAHVARTLAFFSFLTPHSSLLTSSGRTTRSSQTSIHGVFPDCRTHGPWIPSQLCRPVDWPPEPPMEPPASIHGDFHDSAVVESEWPPPPKHTDKEPTIALLLRHPQSQQHDGILQVSLSVPAVSGECTDVFWRHRRGWGHGMALLTLGYPHRPTFIGLLPPRHLTLGQITMALFRLSDDLGRTPIPNSPMQRPACDVIILHPHTPCLWYG
ncbi:uncharacterized protein BO80DRAFT_96902 [Aspergillus ibericus CBS 121593]|uniref:Uncharacterized protein n=1 Tax=Aspergillus ibericus CBS 121593 TaxID=1448316 RepID=A0A395H0C3_9EURO|nr:hypothetical protein BO80DRAFT_96902 [Aspergillus ibericus CBS 121593]RAL00398.1 hypothetical protein BO80DRAFT_96902 [Aspergillus ibericus CBS 121593]